MKYFPLIWAGLWRKPIRTILTTLSISVAFLLSGMLHGITKGFDVGIAQLSDVRLRVQSRAGILTGMPLAHLSRIEQIDGVAGVGYVSVFPAYYKTQTIPMGAAAISMDRFFQAFPDVVLDEDQRQAMLRNRQGALVGEDLAKDQGWHIGDRVTLTSTFYQQADGSKGWTFEIAGIYHFKSRDLPSNEFWFHYEFLDEARTRDKGTVNMYIVTITNPSVSGSVCDAIDHEFINSTYPTITQNEKEWLRSRLDSIGNIQFIVNSIIGAVLFTLLFLTGNTMMQSVRERIPETAILRTYGYSQLTVVSLMLAEAMTLCVVGTLLGLAMAALAFPTIFEGIGIGPVPIPLEVVRDGLLVALALALVSAAPPAWSSGRITVVDALSRRM